MCRWVQAVVSQRVARALFTACSAEGADGALDRGLGALVRAGCPWISHDDVLAALPPGLAYEEAMEALRACRLRITYRY